MNGRLRIFDGTNGAPELPWRAAEAAAYLRVAVQTLYRWNTEQSGPPHFKVRGRLRYWPSEVRAWAESQAVRDGAA